MSTNRELAARVAALEQFLAQHMNYQVVEEGGMELAQEVLGLSAWRIYTLVGRGLPHTKVNRRLRFKRQELLDWQRSRQQETS